MKLKMKAENAEFGKIVDQVEKWSEQELKDYIVAHATEGIEARSAELYGFCRRG